MINRLLKGLWPTLKEVILTEVMHNTKFALEENVLKKVRSGWKLQRQ